MRIAIVGNMNNNAHNLALYLQARGLEVDVLFYSNESSHFSPDSDSIGKQSYQHKNLTWGSYLSLLTTPKDRISGDLEPYDFCIGSRLAPAFFLRAQKKLDIFMPTGGDIWTTPVYTDMQPKNLAKFLFFSRRQARGIQASGALFFDQTNIETEKKIAPVISNLARFSHPIPCLYYPDFEGDALSARMAASNLLPRFRKMRERADIFLVHHVKHLWQKDSVKKFDHLQEKGNDKILLALAQFKKNRPEVRVVLLLTEYGVDVEASKNLIAQLGIEDSIEWIPVSPRKELMMAIHLSDAVIGEIARSWFSYGTIIEGMTMNKPVIHHRDDSYFAGREMYPMLNANNVESIFQALSFLTDRPDDAKAMGLAGGNWLREIAVGCAIDDICSLVDEKSKRIAAKNAPV